MKGRNSYYVTLASNASTQLYSGNNPAHFVNKLLEPLELDDNDCGWEVALLDIHFPQSMVNVPKAHTVLNVTLHNYLREKTSTLGSSSSPASSSTSSPAASVPGSQSNSRPSSPTGPPPPPSQAHASSLSAATLPFNLTIEELLGDTTRRVFPFWNIPLGTVLAFNRKRTLDTKNPDLSFSDSYVKYGYRKFKYYENTSAHGITVALPRGCYTSVKAIVEHLNHAVTTALNDRSWKFMIYDEMSGRVGFYTHGYMRNIHFYNTAINQILGFTKENRKFNFSHLSASNNIESIDTGITPIYADALPDITNGKQVLFVYADFLDTELIGDTVGQLLQRIQTLQATGSLHFAYPMYKRVIRKTISTAEIQIRDHLGEKVDFLRGATYCTVHFRRCSV